MAWQDVEVDLGGSRRGRVQWSVTVKQGGARITVPMDVIKVMGWTATTALKLQVGTGDNAGSIRLATDPKGPIHATKPYANAKSLQFRLGFWEGLVRQDQQQVAIRFEFEGVALVLHPPAVAHATVQAAPAPATAKAAIPPPPADTDNTRGQPAKLQPRPSVSIMTGPPPERPTAAKRDVTHQFFDDPKRPVQMASGVRGGRTS